MSDAKVNWIPVRDGGPRPDGFALWAVPNHDGVAQLDAVQAFYARDEYDGGGLMDAWGRTVGWAAADASHYAEIGPLPNANEPAGRPGAGAGKQGSAQ